MSTAEHIRDILSKKEHHNVVGISVSIANGYNIETSVACGYSNIKNNEIMTSDHYLECASLSKTVATAFALDYFDKRNIPL